MNRQTPPHRFSLAAQLAAIALTLIAGIGIGRFSATPGDASAAPPTPRGPGQPSAQPAAAVGGHPLFSTSSHARDSSPPTTSDWEGLLRQPPAPARDAAAAAWLARYAAHAPAAALALAAAEPHRTRRAQWRAAALRGWAASAPEAAAAWIIAQPPSEDRVRDIAASLAGAATDPAAAQALAGRYATAFPDRADETGSTLIAALAEAGDFAGAARFATSGDGAREAWTASAFARWSEQQPHAATAAAQALPDPALRDVAWRAAVANWAQNEPGSLAAFATRLPSGEARTYALGEALRVWVEQDAPAASRWLDQFDPRAETDMAVSLIATQRVLGERRPDVAIGWAESIADPLLRSRTLARVIRTWADVDPAAADRYARTTPALTPADREVALPGELFTPHP